MLKQQYLYRKARLLIHRGQRCFRALSRGKSDFLALPALRHRGSIAADRKLPVLLIGALFVAQGRRAHSGPGLRPGPRREVRRAGRFPAIRDHYR